jgi:hypothetical protein
MNPQARVNAIINKAEIIANVVGANEIFDRLVRTDFG